MTIDPRPYIITPPTAEEVAERDAQIEAYRRERQRADELSAPVRRRVLEAGPALRDIDAALACHDSCHPTVDVTDRHLGGTTCMCQLSDAERADARRRMVDALASLGPWQDDDQRPEVDRAAAQWGVQVHQVGGLAPFQLIATVDGRSFYLRARHETFTLHLAPADRPHLFTSDVSRWGVGELEIASGDEDDLGPRWVDALAFSVRRIRDYLRQQECEHVSASESGRTAFRFCPLCGVRTVPDAAP